MSRQSGSDRPRDDARGDDPSTDRRTEPEPNPGTWLVSTTLQTVVAVVGLVVVLFALGRAFGVDLLGTITAALTTQTGQWLAVAIIALLVMSAAMRTMRYTRAP